MKYLIRFYLILILKCLMVGAGMATIVLYLEDIHNMVNDN